MRRTRTIASKAVLCLGIVVASAMAQDNTAAKSVPTKFFDENGAYYGPDCDETNYSGAYYTGDYTSPFKTILGKTDQDIQDKIDELWNHYFGGQNDKTVYYEDNDGGYIVDINNNDIRSEGMSYGMMIAVQTNHKEQFGKLWNWAKKHMWKDPATGGSGYFAWQANRDGSVRDWGNAPDGEIYFMMSLLFAAHRWNDEGYMKDAQSILKACWKGNGQSLYSEQSYIATFQPSDGNNSWGDASYSLPAFVDLFSRWSTTNNDKWKKATKATRDHIYNSANPQSGLCSDYSNFDGTPHHAFSDNSTKYAFDAIRCPMNYGMDYYLFGADAERQTKIAKVITDFFEKDGYQHGHFNWDGTGGYGDFTIGQAGANAVATYALLDVPEYKDLVKKVLQKAWDSKPIVGSQRYYDGLVHFLAMLHLTGNFKIWKPKPKDVKEKTMEATTIGDTEFKEGDKIDWFEDCQLYKVTFSAPAAATTPTPGDSTGTTQPGDSTTTTPTPGDSTAVTTNPGVTTPTPTPGDSTDAIRQMYMRDYGYKMQRDYNLKGCKVNSSNRARGAYYGRMVPMK